MITEEFTFVVFSDGALAFETSRIPDKFALTLFLSLLAGVE